MGHFGADLSIAPPIGIRRRDDGHYTVRLPAHERSVLVSLPSHVLALARAGDPSTKRLFPPAYPEDVDAEAEYVALARSELMAGCADALETFRKTIDAELLREDEAMAWMRALNQIRLVIGTKLEVQEGEEYPDPEDVSADDVRAQGLLLYGYLTWLQTELIEAVSTESPPSSRRPPSSPTPPPSSA